MAAVGVPSPAHDAAGAIRAARDVLEQHAARLAAVGDPIAPSISALAAAVGAQNQLAADAFLKTEKLIQDSQTPLTDKQVDDLGRRLLSACQTWARGFVAISYWRNQVVLAIVVLGAVALGFGAGRWAYSSRSELACADQVDGSRLCWMYTRLPTHH